MTKRPLTILVAGDIAVDWIGWSTPSLLLSSYWTSELPNIARYSGYQMAAEPGGALLLAEMIRIALTPGQNTCNIVSYSVPELANIPPEKLLHSTVFLDKFPLDEKSKDKDKNTYRIKWFGGYSGSPESVDPQYHKIKKSNPNIIVFDDAGNYFRDKPEFWSSFKKKRCQIIHKMSAPLCRGELFTTLKEQSENLITIINGEDLRKTVIHLSRQLSWERLAEDFSWQIQYNPEIKELRQLPHLVIRFGGEGAIYYSYNDGQPLSVLIYDPISYENSIKDQYPGEMQGLSDAFTAGFVTTMVQKGDNAILNAIKRGLYCARSLQKFAFGSLHGRPGYALGDTFKNMGDIEKLYHHISIPDFKSIYAKGFGSWSILESLNDVEVEDIASTIVTKGWNDSSGRIPIGTFGALSTVDRDEIESYRSIRNLFNEYLSDTRHIKPLSIAVFGPPGSGKSFGVHQLAKSLGTYPVEKIEFNLSQFKDPDDLKSAFHKVRDMVLEGKIPLVFFDEFDTRTTEPVGWLRYFLAPMQDGVFREGETVHPIGKAIFVFAGGVCHSLDEFQEQEKSGKPGKFTMEEFRNAKGTDFKSRLRGYVNIKSCNAKSPEDLTYLLRRAMILRSVLRDKAITIFDKEGTAQIDPGVLRAFLMTPEFYHGIRSMEAIIDMSILTGKDSYQQSSLPSKEQLALHTNPEIFMRLVEQELFFGNALEDIAKALHEQYLQTTKSIKKMKKKEADEADTNVSEANKPWDELDEEYKQSNREQANHIPVKLRAIRCGYTTLSDKKQKLFTFSDGDIEILAQLEHMRYVEEKIKKGWKYGPIRDEKNKLNPTLVKWEELSLEEKQKDYDAVKKIPQILVKAGFKVYRL
jgi:hypothetical protein